LRGGDAFDFWYRLDAWKGERWRATLAVGVLAKGKVDLYTPYETYYSASHDAPSGTAERHMRLRLEGEWRPAHGLAVKVGAGWSAFRNAGHVRGVYREAARVMAGVAWAVAR
jgi:hypothetical protein